MTRVKRDSHGLYVRNDGLCFRPELTRHSTIRAINTPNAAFSEGEAVRAHHLSGTVHAKVVALDGRSAVWSSHGEIWQKGVTSEACWTPIG